jgi:dihydropyrimidinase
LFKTLLKAAELGMLVMVHAENGDAIEILVHQAVRQGNLAAEWHAQTRPVWTEAEATMRAIALAGLAGATLYVVHMTCEEAVDQLTYGRERGLRVMGETCTHYLFFTMEQLRRPDGAKWICSPPLRTEKDKVFLWKALADNRLQVVSTDHCPFMYAGNKEIEYEGRSFKMPGKEIGEGNFAKTPNGVPGIEHRQLMLWSYGVGQGKISANRFVELTATNPAKIFGLYPRKGTLAVGSDADIVIWNPTAKRVITTQNSHQRIDYNLYEGWEVTGLPEKVYIRGNLVVEGETWHGRPGLGSFIRRSTHALVL